MKRESRRQRNHDKKVMSAAKKRVKVHKKREARAARKVVQEESLGNKKKRSFAKTFGIALLIFLILFVPIGYALNSFLETSPFAKNEEDVKFEVLVDPDSPFFREFSDSKRINVLLMGVNYPLTDTLMLGSFDPETNRVDIISIPRDTYYHREGFDTAADNKINAAFQKKAINTAKAVSDVLLGIPINYYAVVEYDDIEKIVDKMGGVPIYIEKSMDYDDPWDKPPLHIHIPAGEHVLNGSDSVKFLRFRKGYVEGDMGRVKAQQVWIKNALSQALDYGLLKVANVAFEEIESNITYKAMIKLGTQALGMDPENIVTYTMPHTLQQEPPWYVYPDTEGIENLLREIYSIAPETTSDGAVDEGSVEE